MSRIALELACVASAWRRPRHAPSIDVSRKTLASAVCTATVLAAVAAGLGSSAGAQAQPIYRCGSEYTSAPCPEGKPLSNPDSRSAAQREEARAGVEQQKRLAAEMERDRRRDEASIRPALAGSLGPSRPAAAAPALRETKKKHHKKHAFGGDGVGEPFTASASSGTSKHRR